MKLLSFKKDGRESFGAVVGERVVDLGLKFAGRYADLVAVLKAGALAEVESAIAGLRATMICRTSNSCRLFPILRKSSVSASTMIRTGPRLAGTRVHARWSLPVSR